MNILIYDGPGASPAFVSATSTFLNKYLNQNYSIRTIAPSTLRDEPWQEFTSLLVIPGGRDLPYWDQLNCKGNQNILDFMNNGGQVLGICAGGNYMSSKYEFMIGGQEVEVVGNRALKSFPDAGRGPTFEDFQYNSEVGARLAWVKFQSSPSSQVIRVPFYYGDGGSFQNAHLYSDQVTVLGRYEEVVNKSMEVGMILCKIGNRGGQALLSGFHPEFDPDSSKSIKFGATLKEYEQIHSQVAVELLQLLSLKLNNTDTAPKLTPIILTSIPALSHRSILKSLKDQSIEGIFDGSMNQFKLIKRYDHPTDHHLSILPISSANDIPEGLSFNIANFFHHLVTVASTTNLMPSFGSPLLYSDTLTSTQLLLEKNYKFQQFLPSGTLCVASQQISGKGRGNNVWVSPKGRLQFSMLVKHPNQPEVSVILIQSLVGLAVTESLLSLPGYEKLPLQIKWPNNIYGRDYRENPYGKLVKVGESLIQYSISGNQFTLVIGCSVNISNPAPALSINEIIRQHNIRFNANLKEMSQEQFLAGVILKFQQLYSQFLKHQNSIVLGLEPKFGRLKVITTDSNGRIQVGKSELFELKPEGNNFDMAHSKLKEHNLSYG